MLVLASAAILLQGCAYAFNVGELKDNPMDQAIATGIGSSHMKETRNRLLKRFPIGRPVAQVRQYLESVGAKCLNSEGSATKVICRYSKHTDAVLRTPLGDIPEIRSIYDFRIELVHEEGLLRNIRVCRRISRIDYRSGFAEKNKRIAVPMECLKGLDKKGGA